MKGKNFSCNNTGKRKKSDFYETPYSITQQFIDAELGNGYFQKGNLILEPSSGNGAIAKVLRQNGLEVVEKDISRGEDFLLSNEFYQVIITNPPFSLAFEFIQHAKKCCHYLALLLPLSYLHGKKRFDLIYSDKHFPLTKVYVFTRYPMLGEELREDGRYNTGMMVYAWFIWQRGVLNYTHPTIHWLDNNHFVLKKGDI